MSVSSRTKWLAHTLLGIRKYLLCSDVSASDQCDVLFVRHDNNAGYHFGGKAYSPIIDSVLELCSKRGLSWRVVAKPYSSIIGDAAFGAPIVLNRRFFCLAVIRRLLKLFLGEARSHEWVVEKRIGVWGSILAVLQPKVVIGIQPNPDLCKSARRCGIPVYDMQHGVIAPEQWWYGTEGVLAKHTPADEMPSGFLCWDDSSASTLKSWAPDKNANVHVVGHPWFQRFARAEPTDVLVSDALQANAIFADDKPVILVTLQWGLDRYYVGSGFNGIMCNALESTIRHTWNEYNWLIRLHPVQYKGTERKPCLQYLEATFGSCAGVEWRDATELPLPVVLGQCDLHVTEFSAVVIQAAWMGKHSAMLSPYLLAGQRYGNLFSNEREVGLAECVRQTPDAITSWIAAALDAQDQTESSVFQGADLGDLIYSEVLQGHDSTVHSAQ